MHEHGGHGQCPGNVRLYPLGEVVGVLDTPLSRYEDVHGDEATRAGGPGPRGVELDALRFVPRLHVGNDLLFIGRQRGIEQAVGRIV